MLTGKQLFLSDADSAFSSSFGWASGGRNARYALIIDHGKIVYAEKEPGREVTVRLLVTGIVLESIHVYRMALTSIIGLGRRRCPLEAVNSLINFGIDLCWTEYYSNGHMGKFVTNTCM